MQDQRGLLESIPVTIRQMAEMERLGGVVAVMDKRKRPVRYAVGVFFIGVLVIGFIALSAIALAFFFLEIYLTIVLLMLLILVSVVFGGYQDAKKRANDLMVIYDGGLAIIDKEDARTVHWDKIDKVLRGTLATPEDGKTYLSDIDTMKIHGPDGQVYMIDAKLPKHLRARICDVVERGLVESRLMGMGEVYDRGGSCSLGRLS